MRVELVNPFIKSLKNAFQTMLGCEVKRGDLRVKQGATAAHEISGVIGLTGNSVGTVVLSLSRNVALEAASTMLMTPLEEVDDDVLDAIGELTNMVAGAAKAELKEFNLAVSLPNVISGENHDIHFPSNVKPICIEFTSPWGPLALEVGLAEVPAAVGANT